MNPFDQFATTLFEQAKRFLEKANEALEQETKSAYCNVSLLLGFCSLEAHLNAIAEELTIRSGLDVLDRSILEEKDYVLESGRFELTKKLKMYRLEDRLQYIFTRFSTSASPTKESWWADLKKGLDLRNRLVHPKLSVDLNTQQVRRSLEAILECLNALYLAVFSKPYQTYKRSLDSKLTF